MKAIPVLDGRYFNNSIMASNPPADAPMATTGKVFSFTSGFAGVFFFAAFFISKNKDNHLYLTWYKKWLTRLDWEDSLLFLFRMKAVKLQDSNICAMVVGEGQNRI